MSHTIQYTSDSSGGLELVRGSDARFNVSARQDSRSYYNSRDKSQAFSLVWDDASSAAGDYILHWKNTSDKHLVIDSVGLNTENAGSFKLHVVTGTAVGTAVVPFCLNTATIKPAVSTAVEAAGTAITGLTSIGVVDHAAVSAGGHEEFRLDDRLRIGLDGALAVEFEQGTTGRTWGVIFGYFE